MPGVVVVGSQWGDEGKGKITDYLSSKADVVVRYQGGNNAGHTIEFNNQKYALRLVPSGIFSGNPVVLGNGMVINPKALLEEIKYLNDANINTSKILISDRAHVILPYHLEIDALQEKYRGDKNIGTTKKGIGPTYVDKYARIGIRMGEFVNEELFKERLAEVLPLKKREYPELDFSVEGIFEEYKEYAKIIKPMVCDTALVLDEAFENKKNILFEGAQGTMLDIDYGTYPYVTSSHPGANGVCEGAGVGPVMIDEAIGIVKAYTTRVGSGAFPTEIEGEIANTIREVGREYGTVTKRPRRIGWFDAVVVNQSRRMSGLTGISLMLLDVLTGVEELSICTAYTLDGKVIHALPSTISELDRVQPVLETMPGWSEDITTVTSFAELPENCKKYLHRIEELIKCPIVMFSVGPDRTQTIVLKEVF
ncbi:adenylosuccinate synthase [Tannockella kyphosi]|uniref:adenylosuccinate synthase n=1 Tax=Tannockella kyphosi TaxID=2899121 RepID=UPI002012D070|nr:adenylosuccinate synthase [Tannockella kyphosi]